MHHALHQCQVAGKPAKVLFIDTEGLFSPAASQEHDARVFALTLLLAHALVYNGSKAITDGEIENLALAARFMRSIRAASSGGHVPPPASLVWASRNWQHDLVDADGCALTPNQYLEDQLAVREHDFKPEAAQARESRKVLQQVFPRRAFVALPRPVSSEEGLAKLPTAALSDVEPAFLLALDTLTAVLFGEGNTRRSSAPVEDVESTSLAEPHRGARTTGPMLLELITSFVDALNAGGVPDMSSAWSAATKQAASDMMHRAQQAALDTPPPNPSAGPMAWLQWHASCKNPALAQLQQVMREYPDARGSSSFPKVGILPVPDSFPALGACCSVEEAAAMLLGASKSSGPSTMSTDVSAWVSHSSVVDGWLAAGPLPVLVDMPIMQHACSTLQRNLATRFANELHNAQLSCSHPHSALDGVQGLVKSTQEAVEDAYAVGESASSAEPGTGSVDPTPVRQALVEAEEAVWSSCSNACESGLFPSSALEAAAGAHTRAVHSLMGSLQACTARHLDGCRAMWQAAGDSAEAELRREEGAGQQTQAEVDSLEVQLLESQGQQAEADAELAAAKAHLMAAQAEARRARDELDDAHSALAVELAEVEAEIRLKEIHVQSQQRQLQSRRGAEAIKTAQKQAEEEAAQEHAMRAALSAADQAQHLHEHGGGADKRGKTSRNPAVAPRARDAFHRAGRAPSDLAEYELDSDSEQEPEPGPAPAPPTPPAPAPAPAPEEIKEPETASAGCGCTIQ